MVVFSFTFSSSSSGHPCSDRCRCWSKVPPSGWKCGVIYFFFVISFCESEKWRWLPNCLIMMAVGRWWKLRGKWAGWDFSRYIIRLNQATYEKNSQFASVNYKIPLKIRVYYYVEKELRKKTRKWNHYNDVLTCYFWTYLQSSSDVFQNIVR